MKSSYLIAFACWIVMCAGSAHCQDDDTTSIKGLTNSQLKAKLEEKERELKDLQALRSARPSPRTQVSPSVFSQSRDPFAPSTSFGQQNQRSLPALATRDYVAGFATFPTSVNREAMKANRAIDREISELVGKIKKSDSDEEKQELKNEIQQLLEKQYDSYLDQHEAPLMKLEERLEKLKSDLQARKEAKEDLVRLRLDSIWYQALDLRWPGGSGARTMWRDSDPFGTSSTIIARPNTYILPAALPEPADPTAAPSNSGR